MAAEETGTIPEKTTRVHVTNLPFALTTDQLTEFFSSIGKVKSASIVTKQNGISRGFGFVEYDSLEDSARCVAELNNQLVQERRIGVVYSTSQGPYEATEKTRTYEDGDECALLHVRELYWGVKRAELEQTFEPYGTIVSCKVVKNPRNGRSRGYGFVEFENVEQARAAKTALNGKELQGRAILILFSKSDGPRPSRAAPKPATKPKTKKAPAKRKKTKRIVVKNLSEGTTVEEVENHFAQYGNCQAKLQKSKQGSFYSFVTFDTPEEAGKAVTDKGSIGGNELNIVFAQRVLRSRKSRNGRRGGKQKVELQATQI